MTREKYAYEELKDVVAAGRLVITVKEVLRRGDVLILTVNVLNNTGTPLVAEASLAGTAGQGNVDFWDSRVTDFGLAKGESKVVSMKVYLPEATATKIIQADYGFRSLASGNVTVEQAIHFE